MKLFDVVPSDIGSGVRRGLRPYSYRASAIGSTPTVNKKHGAQTPRNRTADRPVDRHEAANDPSAGSAVRRRRANGGLRQEIHSQTQRQTRDAYGRRRHRIT
jgi:hypothetical protein